VPGLALATALLQVDIIGFGEVGTAAYDYLAVFVLFLYPFLYVFFYTIKLERG
jgi:hypothetical protein